MTTFSRASGVSAVRASSREAIAAWLVILATAIHVPLLRSDVSWRGDDTLHYLNHAGNIAQGRPFADTGYIYSPLAAEVGPQNYPVAFPLALAPIYTAAGLSSFTGYKVFGLAMLASILALTASWCRRAPPGVAFATVATLAFNPVLVQSAVAIVSDPMFAVLAIAALLVIDEADLRRSNSIAASVGAGLLIWAACSTRSAGFAILAALAIKVCANRFDRWRPALVTIGVSLALVLVTGAIVGGSSAVSDYTTQFSSYEWTTPIRNAKEYAGDLASEFLWPIAGGSSIGKVALLAFAAMVVIGLRRTLRERGGPTIWEYFAVVYVALLLVWPAIQGSRFLLPLLPWSTRLAWIGVDEASARIGDRRAAAALRGALLAVVVLLCVPSFVAEVQARGLPVEDGIDAPAVQQLLAYVRDNTDPSAVFVAGKPRALALLGRRHAAAFPRGQSDAATLAYFHRIGATQLVIDAAYPRDVERVVPFATRNRARFEPVFANQRFTVLALRQVP